MLYTTVKLLLIATIILLLPLELYDTLSVTCFKPPVSQEQTKATTIDTKELRTSNILVAKYKHLAKTEARQLVKTVFFYAKSRNLDPHFVLAVISVESKFKAKSIGQGEYYGYMQVSKSVHASTMTPHKLLESSTNIEIGTKILKRCHSGKSKRKAIACYIGSSNKEKVDKYMLMVTKQQQLFTKT